MLLFGFVTIKVKNSCYLFKICFSLSYKDISKNTEACKLERYFNKKGMILVIYKFRTTEK